MAKARRGFSHWFRSLILPSPTNDEECLKLYYIIRGIQNGHDLKLRELCKHKVIEGHIRLAMSLVAEFAMRAPNRTNEMVSVALEALIDGIEMIERGAIDHHSVPNITGYLIMTVRGRISKFLTGDGVFRCDLKTYKKLKDSGKDMPIVILDLSSRHLRIPVLPSSEMELKELFNAIAQDKKEKQVLDLRIVGYNDPQIAQMMGLTKQRVAQIRKKIGEKFLESYK